MTFPLLRLPFLALESIIKSMILPETFLLATVSRKSGNAVRESLRAQHFILDLTSNQEFSLYNPIGFRRREIVEIVEVKIENAHETEQVHPEFWKIFGRVDVPVKIERSWHLTRICTRWVDRNDVFLDVLRWFVNIFKLTEVNLKFRDLWNERIERTIWYLQQFGVEIEKINISVSSNRVDDTVLRYALENFRNHRHLTVCCETSDEFHFENDTPFDFDSVTIRYSEWVTKDHIVRLFMDCRVVFLTFAEPDKEEMGEILTKWVEGCRLEELTLIYDGTQFEALFENFENVVPIGKAKIDGKVKRFGRVRKCFQIQNKAGKKTMVYTKKRPSELFHLSTDFRLGVDDEETDWTDDEVEEENDEGQEEEEDNEEDQIDNND